MSQDNSILEVNRELACKINEEARRNPQSPYANKFVGIANGQVAVVADSDEGNVAAPAGNRAGPAEVLWR
jgi:hypothetical protein